MNSYKNERLLDYIKELEVRLMAVGEHLPIMREDIGELLEYNKGPLLQIELTDINSIPTVCYKGEEINNNIRLSFDYATDTDVSFRPTYIHIKYTDPENYSIFNTKTIQHNQPIGNAD